jgi:hypothetical protein
VFCTVRRNTKKERDTYRIREAENGRSKERGKKEEREINTKIKTDKHCVPL